MVAALDTTESTVRYRLDKLRAADKIARVGPDKGGHRKVLDNSASHRPAALRVGLFFFQTPRSPRPRTVHPYPASPGSGVTLQES